MGSSTLTNRAAGQTILDTFFNDIHAALGGDFVGRNASGVATAGQNNGTNALPWGTGYFNSIVLNGSAVDTSLLTAPKNRIVSGKTRSASNQPQFIDPNGAAASFILEGATTNLVLDVNGSAVSVTTDITKSSLTVGPSTTATCLVNDTDAADQESTKTWGEHGSEKETITVDAMGAEFQAFIGQWVIVQIAGVATEYALVFVKSSTELTNAYRGFFYDSSAAPVNRTGFFNNDTITVLSTGWVFVENDGATVDVTYTNPIRSFTAPSGPATGDYWYDLDNETWKRYDGASFQIINRTLVGVVGIDSANCVCARSFDFFAKYQETNNINLEINSTEIVQIKDQYSKVNVYGKEFVFGFNHENWNITTDLAASADMYNATEQASTFYYAYVKDTGETVISDISPHYRPDLLGEYHPHNPWRYVGEFFNNASNNIERVSSAAFINSKIRLHTGNGHGSTNTKIRRFSTTIDYDGVGITYDDSATDGGLFTIEKTGRYSIDYVDQATGGQEDLGLSLNSTELTTDISAITTVDRLDLTQASSAGGVDQNSSHWTGKLSKGDKIRAHTGATNILSGSTRATITITRLG